MSVILFIILWYVAGQIANLIGVYLLEITYTKGQLIFVPLIGGVYLAIFIILTIIVYIMEFCEEIELMEFFKEEVDENTMNRFFKKIKNKIVRTK